MPNKVIKLIALDIDGTIMNKNYRISNRIKHAVEKAIKKGVYVLVATGRMYSATVPIGLELGLKTPLVVYQGSMVREFYKSDDILLHHMINSELSYQLVEDLRKENIQINVYCDDKLYTESDSPMLQEYVTRRKIPFQELESFGDIKNFLPTKIMAMDPDITKVDAIKQKLQEKYSDKLNITKSTDYFLEFVDIKCSKAGAILFLAERWGIQQHEIMAVGDQDNDRGMIEIAGFGIAMGNSHNDLKQAADYVTDTVDNDGAALAIEKFVLS
ncbi:MAG: hypothetical protein A2Y25_10015 [Candidatus Melainabacteria bacterium GWF2_37_15]|nr:MAG: hypothetical protein A2Y25_10015 [Candidatus Melainabacteria bacterium GWF2_37_15]